MFSRGALFVSCVVVLSVLLFAAAAEAGWIIVDKDGETTYISAGKIKSVSDGEMGSMSHITDVKSGLFTSIDHKRKVYARGKPDEFCEAAKSLGEEMKNAMLQKLSPEERKMFEAQIKEFEAVSGKKGKGGAKQKPRVSVAKTGAGEVIAGQKTEKYTVTVNGEKFEDVWIATGFSMDKEMKEVEAGMLVMVKRMEKCMGPAETDEDPYDSPEYEKLMSRGFVMKEVSYMGGPDEGEVESEVVKLEKKNIPSSEFSVPSGFKKINLKEFLMGQMGESDLEN